MNKWVLITVWTRISYKLRRSICWDKNLYLHVYRSWWESIIDGVSSIFFWSFLPCVLLLLLNNLHGGTNWLDMFFVTLISPDTLDQLEVAENFFGKNVKYLQGWCIFHSIIKSYLVRELVFNSLLWVTLLKRAISVCICVIKTLIVSLLLL